MESNWSTDKKKEYNTYCETLKTYKEEGSNELRSKAVSALDKFEEKYNEILEDLEPFTVERLVVDSENPQFAVVCMNDKLKHEIRIYDPLILCGDNPIAVYTLHDELIYDIIYFPIVSQKGSYLVYLNQDMELKTIEDSKKSSKHLSEANLSEEENKKITRSKKRHRSIK
ncbi:259_t:CDS:2 [Entrophospora sp. SA101]|nr:259_t:CDS:2 [Entrophospora sp. SA101]